MDKFTKWLLISGLVLFVLAYVVTAESIKRATAGDYVLAEEYVSSMSLQETMQIHKNIKCGTKRSRFCNGLESAIDKKKRQLTNELVAEIKNKLH